MKQITSAANPQFKIWRTLLNSRGIKNEGLFLLSGEKIIREHLKNPKSSYEVIAEIIREEYLPLQTQAEIFQLSKELFNELDIIGTHFNLLVMKIKKLPISMPENSIEGLEVIVPVGDPSNLGALIRSCVAFGVSKIHLTTESANPFHPKSLKASAGSILQAPLFEAGPLKNWDHSSVWALDGKGPELKEMKCKILSTKIRIMVGEEGPGLPPLENASKVSIPTQSVESLNATVAASLLIWELHKR
jgi:RNA methyltransferase, TrmH family